MGMMMIFSKLSTAITAAILAVGLSGAAFAQGAAPSAQSAGQGGGSGPNGYSQQGDENAAGPSGGTRPLQMPVLYVTGIEVLHATMDPKEDIIRVTGLASSAGWSEPVLVPFFYGKPTDDVLDLQFIATSPEQSQKAEGFMPVSAEFNLEPGHPFKGVRVRAYGNALELKQISGAPVTTQIKINDCKECIGKKFVEKGQGASAPDVVYGGDLPPDYRPIGPTHGVKGQIHDPNRINLILDADNKIVMAFWE
jgi:hypothetical protein